MESQIDLRKWWNLSVLLHINELHYNIPCFLIILEGHEWIEKELIRILLLY